MRFVLATFLILFSGLILVLTEFNAIYVFADPGLVDSKAGNLWEWFTLVRTHGHELALVLNELVGVLSREIGVPGHLPGRLLSLLLFVSPAIAVLSSWKVPRLQFGILVVLILLILDDLSVMLSFNGYNSANGGYDGMDQMVTFFLHVLVGWISNILGVIGLTISVLRWRRAKTWA